MAPKSPTLRITGGEWRSRVIQVPADTTTTRPTMDQTRQAVFNILLSADWALKDNGQPRLFEGTVMDVFAGSGSMAFEALSRGAAQATVVERDPKAVAVIQTNADTLRCTAQVKVIRGDVLRTGVNPGAPVAICFLDPPYNEDVWVQSVHHLKNQNWIDGTTLLVIESSSKTGREFNAAAEGQITIHDQRRYGHALVTFGIIHKD